MKLKNILSLLCFYLIASSSASAEAGGNSPCDMFTNPLSCLGELGGEWLIDSGFDLEAESTVVTYVSEPKENPLGLHIEVRLRSWEIENIVFRQPVSRYSMSVGEFSTFRTRLVEHCYYNRYERNDEGVCDNYPARIMFSYRGVDLEALRK